MNIQQKYKTLIQGLVFEVYIDGALKGTVEFNTYSGLWDFTVDQSLNRQTFGAATRHLSNCLNHLEQWLKEYCKAHSLEYPLSYWLGDIIDGPMIVTTFIYADGQWRYKAQRLGSEFIGK